MQALFLGEPRNFSKLLRSNSFEKFLGSGLSAERCKFLSRLLKIFFAFGDCDRFNAIATLNFFN